MSLGADMTVKGCGIRSVRSGASYSELGRAGAPSAYENGTGLRPIFGRCSERRRRHELQVQQGANPFGPICASYSGRDRGCSVGIGNGTGSATDFRTLSGAETTAGIVGSAGTNLFASDPEHPIRGWGGRMLIGIRKRDRSCDRSRSICGCRSSLRDFRQLRLPR